MHITHVAVNGPLSLVKTDHWLLIEPYYQLRHRVLKFHWEPRQSLLICKRDRARRSAFGGQPVHSRVARKVRTNLLRNCVTEIRLVVGPAVLLANFPEKAKERSPLVQRDPQIDR